VAKKKAKKAADAKAEMDRKWQHILQRHHEYARRRRVPDGLLKLDDLTGSYIVQCNEIVERYAPNEVMTLDISKPRNPHGTEAAFYFGFLEGTMLLAISENLLQMLRQDAEVDSDEDADSGEDADPDEDGLQTGVYGNSGSRKRRADGAHAVQRSIKRKLGETPKINRIYLQRAGRETGESEIQLDTDNEHTGYLDVDESKLSAKRSVLSPFLVW
jgi:hypothetical protein